MLLFLILSLFIPQYHASSNAITYLNSLSVTPLLSQITAFADNGVAMIYIDAYDTNGELIGYKQLVIYQHGISDVNRNELKTKAESACSIYEQNEPEVKINDNYYPTIMTMCQPKEPIDFIHPQSDEDGIIFNIDSNYGATSNYLSAIVVNDPLQTDNIYPIINQQTHSYHYSLVKDTPNEQPKGVPLFPSLLILLLVLILVIAIIIMWKLQTRKRKQTHPKQIGHF